jgi:predicted O-linked N-acetylglucosamine transferase (SPINDLY family)
MPIIPYSQDDIVTRRNSLEKSLQTLQEENLSVEDPAVDLGITNFYLAYHNQNNRSLMQSIAQLYIKVCPELAFEAQHCQTQHKTDKDILRIGFLSSCLRDHTVGKLTRGIIEHLSRDLFEVTVFHLLGKKDHISEAIDASADKVVTLSRSLERDRQVVESEELDILFYPDIGMDPYTYLLSFSRLAPVQAVSWGHPDTTGVPNIDYFISSSLLEIPEASSHYSEHLIRLPYVPTYYFRPDIPEVSYTRDAFGLPDEGHLYVCPQTLFKFHPQFDTTLGELLRRDRDGYLILIDDQRGGSWRKLLYERFNRSFPEVVDRVTFVPHMPREKYLGLLTIADVILDIPTFSGGNSSLEALAMGAPVITWPQDYMRGRVTAALYKQMGMNELIVTDEETYLALALRLAQDLDFKKRMQADIRANVAKLYERHEVVREMEKFFIAAYEASTSAKPLGDWGGH